MKKLLLLIFISISLLSCKKDKNQKCYHCIIGSFGSNPGYETDYCGDDGGARHFRDAAGNDLSSWCQEK